MKPCVYILRFSKSGRYYIGSTTDLERRVRQHQLGHTASTRFLGEFEVVFTQEVTDIATARTAERHIKSWKRKDYIERVIEDGCLNFLKKAA